MCVALWDRLGVVPQRCGALERCYRIRKRVDPSSHFAIVFGLQIVRTLRRDDRERASLEAASRRWAPGRPDDASSDRADGFSSRFSGGV